MDDFCDWEVLPNSEISNVGCNSFSDPAAAENFEKDELGVASSQGVIRADYFSLETQSKPALSPGDSNEVESDASDKPSWIDPASPMIPCPQRNSGDFWSDSGSDRSDSRMLSDSGDRDKLQSHGSCGLGELFLVEDEEKNNNFVKYWSDSGKTVNLLYNKNDLGFVATPLVGDDATEEFGQETGAAKGQSWSDSGGLPDKIWEIEVSEEAKEKADDCSSDAELGASNDDEKKNSSGINKEMDSGDTEEEATTRVVWWKVPLELLKFCVFKVSPVWTFSLAAAVMGFVILGRRLYRMKRKALGLQLKVTMDDKKVSQFMSRAARLNEAFSVVRRVPVIRPSMPTAPGVAPWPVMSLR